MELEKTQNSVVAEALNWAKKAAESRDAAIKELLAQRQQIDRDLATLGYNTPGHAASVPPQNGNGSRTSVYVTTARGGRVLPVVDSKRFKNLRLAEVGRILLTEHETLHGSEIEKLAKAGGFTGGTENFQNYMPVAFKRAGGFENIGRNTWRLNPAIPPQR